MGLALLDALRVWGPGMYLAGEDFMLFYVDDGVDILLNLLCPHYAAWPIER